jgi:hypothetical protein
MTNKRKSIELRDLSDEIDESILGASDADVSEELASLGIDPDKVAAEMDAIAQEAKRMAKKSRLAGAKGAVSAFRSKRPSAAQADRSGLRAKFQKMRSGRRGDNDGLMMAARKGEQVSQADEEGALDDLAQLEALESEDPEASKE